MRRYTWFYPGLVAAVLLGACQAGEQPPGGEVADDGDGGGVASTDKLIIVEPDQGPRSGWAVETDDAFVLTRLGIAEPLLKLDFDGELVPYLAESWERVDETTWTFQLRDDVQFQDGEALTATAVADALTFLLERPTPARGFNPAAVEAVEADGEHTVTVRTVGADELLPLRLSSPNTIILSPNAYGEGPAPDPLGTGTGPFILDQQVRDDLLELVANDSYWGGDVGISAAQMQVIPEGDIRAGMLQAGEAHLTRQLPITSIPVLEQASGVEVLREPEPRTETLYFSHSSPTMEDVRVRQAVLHAIDNQVLAESVLEGGAEPAVGPFPEGQPWSDPGALTSYDHDPERARELLSEAGYEEGELTVSLWTYPGRPYLPNLAVAIQGMLAAAGITADIRVADYIALEPDVLAGDYDMFILSRSHLVDVYDPLAWFEADYTCEGGYNLSQHCDPAFDEAVDEAAGLEDETARWEIYQDLAGALQADAVSAFLVHVEHVQAVNESVQGYRFHPVGHYALTSDMSW